MKKKFFFIALLGCYSFVIKAQNVAINNAGNSPDPSAMLDVSSDSKGILIPRMSTGAILAINNPAKGLLVYDSVKNQLTVNMGTADVPSWQDVVFRSGWSLTGNAGIDTSVNFIGTTDKNPFYVKVNNQVAGILDTSNNVFWGTGAGKLNPGSDNIAIGHNALANGNGSEQVAIGANALPVNLSGTTNTSVGAFTLNNHKRGSSNTVLGYAAMNLDTSGYNNTAIGFDALYNNRSSFNNTAVGINALYTNSSGSYNTGVGSGALQLNTSGAENNAFGRRALYNNSTGYSNIGFGNWSLYSNTTASNLVAVGDSALYTNGIAATLPVHATGNTGIGSKAMLKNTIGYSNTAVGFTALHVNTIGYANCVIGYNALGNNINGFENTAVGSSAGAGFTSNQFCTFIGNATDASTNLVNATAIGYNAIVNDDNKIRLGNSAVTVIEGAASFTVSDGRFKEDVKENVPGLDFIALLKPVTFRYKSYELDKFLLQKNTKSFSALRQSDYTQSEGMVHMGFIAQDVEQLIKQKKYDLSLVKAPANATDNYSMAYSELIAPLVKAVQEQQQQIETLKKENTEIKGELHKLMGEIKNK